MYWIDTWISLETAWFRRLRYSGVTLADITNHNSARQVEPCYIKIRCGSIAETAGGTVSEVLEVLNAADAELWCSEKSIAPYIKEPCLVAWLWFSGFCGCVLGTQALCLCDEGKLWETCAAGFLGIARNEG
jgi:hypothetical protein